MLPIYTQLKDGSNGTPSWNKIQHPPPTINEGIADIIQSVLTDEHKMTIIAAISGNPKTSKGDELFLPLNYQTKVGNLETRIQCLSEQLDKMSA